MHIIYIIMNNITTQIHIRHKMVTQTLSPSLREAGMGKSTCAGTS